jgi:hypothetical protein
MSASFMLLLFSILQEEIKKPSIYISFVNVGIMFFSAFSQPLIGFYIDYALTLQISVHLCLKSIIIVLPLVLIPAYTMTYSIK